MNKLTNKPTDLQAALRKAYEEAAKYLPEPRGISDADVADIIERRMSPVFEALRDSVIEECAKANCEWCRKGYPIIKDKVSNANGFYYHKPDANGLALQCSSWRALALKGAPR